MSKRKKKITVELTYEQAEAVLQSLLSQEVFLRNRATEQTFASGAIRDTDWADVHSTAYSSLKSALRA